MSHVLSLVTSCYVHVKETGIMTGIILTEVILTGVKMTGVILTEVTLTG